jgi:hypothetical protein
LRAARTGASGAPWTCFKISKSRGAIARVPATDSARVMPGATPSETVEGAGKTGCPLHPRPTRKNMFARARVDHRYRRNHAGLPCAMVYGLLRALPGEPACCHRRLRKGAGLLEDLAPAWARQDHTTSPSAKRAARQSALRVHRIPPRVRDDASAPLAGTGPVDHTPNSTFCKTELFSSRALDRILATLPVGQIGRDFRRAKAKPIRVHRIASRRIGLLQIRDAEEVPHIELSDEGRLLRGYGRLCIAPRCGRSDDASALGRSARARIFPSR